MVDERTRRREREGTGTDSGVAWNLKLSMDYARSGRAPEAAEAARRAVEGRPTNRSVRRWLARLGLNRGPWPGSLGDGNNACASRLLGARVGRIAWSLTLPGLPCGTPVVGPAGRIYITTRRDELVTVSADGEIEHVEEDWNADVTPTFDATGRLVAVCRRRGLLRSNYKSRFPSRRRPEPEALEAAFVDPHNGRAYTVFGGAFSAIHGTRFRRVCDIELDARRWARPAPAFLSDGRVVVGIPRPYAGEVRCFDQEDQEVWRFEARSVLPGPVVAAASEGRVVARIGDQVYGLSDVGEVVWQRKTHVPDWWRLPHAAELAPVAISRGVALLATSWGVTAVSCHDGRELFERRDIKASTAMAADPGGFHLSMPGRIVGIDRGGRTLYEVNLPGRGHAAQAPAIGFGGRTLAIVLDALVSIA